MSANDSRRSFLGASLLSLNDPEIYPTLYPFFYDHSAGYLGLSYVFRDHLCFSGQCRRPKPNFPPQNLSIFFNHTYILTTKGLVFRKVLVAILFYLLLAHIIICN